MKQDCRKIFTIGETVLDILFKHNTAYHSTPGGSMLNVAVSLARLGCNTHFISEISNDLCGNLVLHFLQENHISTDYLSISSDGKTPIAIALLDENNDAHYNFYREFPKKRFNISPPQFSENDIVAFGSFFAISKVVRKPLLQIIKAAKNANALIFYDPNIRKNHCPLTSSEFKMVRENIALADVVRGSDEDFFNIFGINDLEEVYQKISANGCNNIFITCGKEGVWFKNDNNNLQIPSKPIQPISTIGAGDTFNAGVLYGLTKHHIFKNNITEQLKYHATDIIKQAIEMSSEVCLSHENYISTSFHRK